MRKFLHSLLLCFIVSIGSAQVVVPTFGVRGSVEDDFLQVFMSEFRAVLSAASGLQVNDPGSLITQGIAGSLDADLTLLIADIAQERYAISGEISEDTRLLDKAPFSVRVLIVDAEQQRSSDIISLPLSLPSQADTIRSLVSQLQTFLEPGSLPVSGTAGLFVSSEPQDATVLLNGTALNATPFTDVLMLESGAYEIEIRKEGFLPSSRRVVLKEGETQMERFVLTPVVGGSIQIATYPNARVLLDGQDVGLTPLTLQALPGSHTIYLDRAGFKPIAFDVRVENYRVTQVNQTLEPNSESILFWDARATQIISVNGILQTRGYIDLPELGAYQIDIREAGEKRSFEITIGQAGVYELLLESESVALLP